MATVEDRAAGAIVGAMIGDALSMGCHWYYDIEQLKKECGEWISDYTTPKEGRYHYGCKAGQVSQTGQLYQFLLETLNEKGEYNEEDFCSRIDTLLATLDGTSSGGRYTGTGMIDVWNNRVVLKKPWSDSQCGSMFSDCTDSCVRAVALAARHHNDFPTLVKKIRENSQVQFKDHQVQINSIAFGLTVACLINGMEFPKVSGYLMDLLEAGKLPGFWGESEEVVDGTHQAIVVKYPSAQGQLPGPDSLLWSRFAARAAANPNLRIEPARDAPQMYGLACAFYMVMPGAYYLSARFPDDFETAVLTAVNSGGQNLARASLTGGLVGAMTGLSSFPERFIKGLEDGDKWVEIAKKVATDGLQ